MNTLAEVLSSVEMTDETKAALTTALLAREDEVADRLRLIGAQFGMFPQIVAEALAEVGLGTPLSPEERALVHSQFHLLMTQLQQQQPPDQPGQG